MRLDGEVAVVTGGNSGIGLAISKEFSAEGAQVAILGRDQASLDEATRAIGDSCLAVRGDVTAIADLDRLYAATQAHWGSGIDVLVANAGVGKLVALEEMDEETFDWTSNINFKGAYFTVQRAIPHRNSGGSVVLMGSRVQRLGVAGYSVYCATKAAVRSMARTFSAELVPRGVRVNSIGAGGTVTPFFEKVGLSPAEMEEFGQMMSERIPAHRFAQPEEIAKAALYLASDESAFMAGSELTIDGGHAEICAFLAPLEIAEALSPRSHSYPSMIARTSAMKSSFFTRSDQATFSGSRSTAPKRGKRNLSTGIDRKT